MATPRAALALLRGGLDRRTTAATAFNDVSSRSHAVFTLRITQSSSVGGRLETVTSDLNLVDLAGSERTLVMGEARPLAPDSI